jgi:hypothetical protein
MDDGLAGLAFILAIIAVIVGIIMFLISIGGFILAGIAIVGFISGLYVAGQNFFAVLSEAHGKMPFTNIVYVMELYKELYTPQPAKLMYPFGGGWQVMKYVQDNLFIRTQSAANYWYTEGTKLKTKAEFESNALFKYWIWMAYAGAQLAGVVQYITAFIFVALFFCVQFIVLTIWMIAATLLMGLLAIFNFLYGSYFKIFFRCPDCHVQMNIPIYVCPKCATEHTRLWPSVYGVFHHTCLKCETDLPALDVLGRKDIVQKCVECGRPMNKEIGRLINVHIPVIGGPSTGKSNYIFMATHQFIEQYAKPRGIEVTFPDDKHRQNYENNLKLLSDGTALLKTPEIVPEAYILAVRNPKERIGRIVYIYDAAGEAYSVESNTILQTYYKFVHGLILVIDPFSIDLFSRQYESDIAKIKDSIRPSGIDAMDAYERMINVLEASVGLKRGVRFKYPLAIVISKTDALDLENIIGCSAAKELMRKDPSFRLEVDAIHKLVENFLIDYGLGNFVRDVKLQFENVTFFSCSALGRMPDQNDHRPYVPVGVLDPFLWLLGEIKVVGYIRERILAFDEEDRRIATSRGNIFAKAKYYFIDSLVPPKE